MKEEACEVLQAMPVTIMSDDEELSVAPGKGKKWQLLALILARTSQANVNHMNITADILKELLSILEKETFSLWAVACKEPADLPLKHLNLNDNEICATEALFKRVEAHDHRKGWTLSSS